MSGIKTTRRLMETRTPGGDAHKGPEEIEPRLLLAPGMVARDVLEVVRTTETNTGIKEFSTSMRNFKEAWMYHRWQNP